MIPLFVWTIVIIFYSLNIFGSIISYFIIKNTYLNNIRIQKQKEISYFNKRFRKIALNAFIIEPIFIIKNVHIYTLWMYLIIKTIHELNVHSAIRSFLLNKIPIISKIISNT